MANKLVKSCRFFYAISILIVINGCTTTKPISGELSSVVDNSKKEETAKQYKQIVNEIINDAATDFLTKSATFLPPSTTIYDSFRDEFSTIAMLDNGFLRVIEGSQLYTFSQQGDYCFRSRVIKERGDQYYWAIKLVNKKSNKTLWFYQKNITEIY